MERMIKSYGEVDIWKCFEHLCLLFYPNESLSFLTDEPELRYIYNFPQSLEEA